MTRAANGPAGPGGGDAVRPGLPDDRVDGEAAAMSETQSRLRNLLAVHQSLAGSRSADEVAQQLLEAACAVSGARYSRLQLDQVDGSTAQVLEYTPEPERLAAYQAYLQQSPDGILSEFSVSLDTGRQSLGMLQVLDRERGGPFTELTKELLTTLAATGTLILDRAVHYEQAQRRALWLEAMRRVTELVVISEEDELAVWHEIAHSLHRLTASGTVGLQVPGDHDDMHVLIAAGDRAEAIVGRIYPKEESLGWRAMQERRGQLLTAGSQLPLPRHGLVAPHLVGPVMAVPLLGNSGPRGTVTLIREPGQHPFTPDDLELVEDFARQATVALELAEARSARYRLEHAEAREKVARDLHDDVIQRLFAVGLSLQSVAHAEPTTIARQVQQTVQDLDLTIAHVRRTIFTLRGDLPLAESDGSPRSHEKREVRGYRK